MPVMSADGYNLTELLLDRQLAAGRGDKVALVAGERRLSYAQLLERIGTVCATPALRRLAAGSLVSMQFDDELEAAVALLALMRMGLIPCNLNPGLAPKRLQAMLAAGGCAAALCDPAGAARLAGWRGQVLAATAGPVAAPACHRGPASRGAFCLFTSGTTGQPSAVVHRHSDVEMTWRHYAGPVAAIQADDIVFTSSRLFYAYGLNALFFALRAGATAVLAPPSLDAAHLWHTMERERATVCFAVPAIYARLLQAPPAAPPAALRLAVSAGEHLPPALLDQWQRRMALPLIDGIGTTETLCTFISNRPGAVRAGSSGQLVPGFEARITGDDGQPVPFGQVGVLWVRGATCVDAYYNAPAAGAARFADGWFRTNDLFSQDADGWFRYHGRASDIVKCGGIWIYPDRIEDVLLSHPAVLECAVAGQRQDNGLQRPAAWVVLKSGQAASTALVHALQGLCKQRLSTLEYPHFVHFIDDIPKTATGKKMRYQLQPASNQERPHV